MNHITENLMKERLGQAIFTGWPKFKLSYHKQRFSSNSSLEFFDSDQQVKSQTHLILSQ